MLKLVLLSSLVLSSAHMFHGKHGKHLHHGKDGEKLKHGMKKHRFSSSSSAANWDFFGSQVNATLAQIPNVTLYPTNGACAGCYDWATDKAGDWVAGFFSGILFRLHSHAVAIGDAIAAAYWLSVGTIRTQGIFPDQYITSTHDVGFMTMYSLYPMYLATGKTNQTIFDALVTTAHSLATRFSPIVGCFRSWGSPNPQHTFEVIADNMMNLWLIYYIGAETGNTTLTNMAISHSDRMILDIIQPASMNGGGTVWHLITYDDTTGVIMNRSSTPQGLGLNTVWSRGQAWIVHGFTIAYRYTNYSRYLDTAEATALAFLRLTAACCAPDPVPLWDWNATAAAGNLGVDSSASSISASAMVELATYVTDPVSRAKMLSYANAVANALTTTYQFKPSESDAFVKNGTIAYPSGFGVPLIYGDYYLLELLERLNSVPKEWMHEARHMRWYE
jgi:unsaturated chondroitin disaccharide hydrolase